MILANQVAINTINFLQSMGPVLTYIDPNSSVIYEQELCIYSDNTIYHFIRKGTNTWDIDIDDNIDTIENVNTNRVISFINRLRDIEIILMNNLLNGLNPSQDVVIYRCSPDENQINYYSKLDKHIRIIQQKFRKRRQNDKQLKRHQISQELIHLPPSKLLPQGGIKYQSLKDNAIKLGMKP